MVLVTAGACAVILSAHELWDVCRRSMWTCSSPISPCFCWAPCFGTRDPCRTSACFVEHCARGCVQVDLAAPPAAAAPSSKGGKKRSTDANTVRVAKRDQRDAYEAARRQAAMESMTSGLSIPPGLLPGKLSCCVLLCACSA